MIMLDDPAVAVAGDWHGNSSWIGRALPALHRDAPEVRTVLHVGDFWPNRDFLTAVDFWCETAGIDLVLVTLGNHEPWAALTPLLERGAPAELSEHVTILPRPYRFTVGGRSVLSLGGAASVDRQWRREGVDWRPDERITDEMVERAVDGGRADLMVTHESPEGTPVEVVRRLLAGNPHGFPAVALAYSAASREQLSRVWDAVRPELLVHGHMHAAGGGVTGDGRRVMSLGCDEQRANIAVLDMATLTARAVQVF
ncbi:metallophosphoesterase family protein [Microbacterium enclense]|uniref:metallophosphoesterase family protein n=1 Tax=Microbacterium enclense TaxID=993073 RepID=UPI003F81714A